ncbi:MAG TPA: porin family protein [Cyclobacteriaceae bacterium]|jgi:hypothetical protein|nr:porin family protein [Cyclobacteriaceae bacterium]
MKKLLSITSALALTICLANAQSFSIGARAGLNLAKQTVSGSGVTASADSRTSFILGGYATIMFSDKLGLQPELFYSGTGAKQGSAVEKINYLTLPVFLRYNVTENFHLLAGPQLGFLLSAKDDAGNDIKDQVNSSDFGIVPGVGVDFGPFNAGLRYSLGLSNIAKSAPSGFTVKNNIFQVVVGYKLFGK